MIEVTRLGVLLGTLTSALSLVPLLVALGSAAYVAEAAPSRRGAGANRVGAAAAAVLVGVIGLRVGPDRLQQGSTETRSGGGYSGRLPIRCM